MKLQKLSYSGEWEETDNMDYVDQVIGRETWFAPRKNREPMTTREQVFDYLATGKTIKFDDFWNAEIRDGDAFVVKQSAAPKMVKCSCGHTVLASLVMNASLGTSCPDCYDRMSGV